MVAKVVDIVVYSRPGCSDCIVLDEVLRSTGAVYDHRDITQDPKAKQELFDLCDLYSEDRRIPLVGFIRENQGVRGIGEIYIEPHYEELEEIRALAERFVTSGRPEM